MQLQELTTVFVAENMKLNLSAHRTKERVWEGNVMDSLGAYEWIASHYSTIPRPHLHANPPYPQPFPHGGKGDPLHEKGPLDMEKYAKEKVPESLLAHAREMRNNPTPAEKALWKHLRQHQLHQHFRRQHPVGNSILDFYCHKFQLGIEIDGDVHQGREEWDTERSENLHGGYGIHILRFSNDEVLHKIEYVLQSIRDYMRSPPPVGEGPGVGAITVEEEELGVEEPGVGAKEDEEEGIRMEGLKILDLGTGGGFPLLPLAITFPQHHFTGLDSTRKKIDAVQRIRDELKLANVTLVTGRAEELARNHAHREQYDIVTVRAVAETAILLEYFTSFLKVGGRILLWKSMDIEDEIYSAYRAESKLYLQKNPSISYDLGGNWGPRQILIYEKTKATPREYPRPVGSAKKSPL